MRSIRAIEHSDVCILIVDATRGFEAQDQRIFHIADRNKKGIIIDPLHKTLPILTRYEKAKILGLRAKQINHGAKPFVEIPRDVIDGHTIAYMELTQNNIPFIIRRPLPNGGSEYWKVSAVSYTHLTLPTKRIV